MPTPTERISEDRRREIFAALVAAQDAGVPVERSRAQISDQFDVSREEIAIIEREGIDHGWPPL